MSDKRCGTCRHWTRSEERGGAYGECRIIARCIRTAWLHQSFDGTDCPAWSSGDDYSSGWRDAIAAAVKLVETLQPPGAT